MLAATATVRVHPLPDEPPADALARELTDAADRRWPPPPPPPGSDAAAIAWYRLVSREWHRTWLARQRATDAVDRGHRLAALCGVAGLALGLALARALG